MHSGGVVLDKMDLTSSSVTRGGKEKEGKDEDGIFRFGSGKLRECSSLDFIFLSEVAGLVI